METRVNYSVAGIFVIALISAIVMTIIWLSSGFNAGGYQYYTVYMKESVSGLGADGPVEFNGVNVGNVSSMKLDYEMPQVVVLTLKVKKDTPVTEGTRAKLAARALTGTAYILLEDKGGDRTPLRLKAGEIYPVIETTPSLYVRLETALTELNQNFQQLSHSVQTLLNDKNLQNFQKLLESGQMTFHLLETQTIPMMNQTIDTLSDVASEVRQNPAVIIRGRQPQPLGPGEK